MAAINNSGGIAPKQALVRKQSDSHHQRAKVLPKSANTVTNEERIGLCSIQFISIISLWWDEPAFLTEKRRAVQVSWISALERIRSVVLRYGGTWKEDHKINCKRRRRGRFSQRHTTTTKEREKDQRWNPWKVNFRNNNCQTNRRIPSQRCKMNFVKSS